VGNSIAAVSKEIEPQKAIPVTEPKPVEIESISEDGVAASVAWEFSAPASLHEDNGENPGPEARQHSTYWDSVKMVEGWAHR
jgi:hypothetical protein